jgi:hypothetical protein
MKDGARPPWPEGKVGHEKNTPARQVQVVTRPARMENAGERSR